MARGWESKSVEDQMQAAEERRKQVRPQLTPQQIELERKRDSLELQRRRVLNEIETCNDARRKTTLESGLAYLDQELAKL